MTYQNDDRTAVVRHIQELLRSLQINGGFKVTVPIDGIYGKSTTAAIYNLQKENGLNPTGNVDKATYDKLYELSLAANIEAEAPFPLFLLKNGQSISRGENSDIVLIVQILLNTLTVSYDDFEPIILDSVFGPKTEKAVRRFQIRNGISGNGIIDKQTWNILIRNYNKHVENS